MDALKRAQQLWDAIVNGPGLAALELADAVSGGHIKEAARTSDELFSSALDEDTRDAVLMGLDLARLADARFRLELELIGYLLEVADELTQRWSTYEEAQRPELRDLQAASALVASGYARQQSHQRRQIIVDALRGSLCPEPYLWGFQDELLRDLISSGITVEDLKLLRSAAEKLTIEGEEVFVSPTMDSYERLASGGFILMVAQGSSGGPVLVRNRLEAPQGSLARIIIRKNHKGVKLLKMIDAGQALSKQTP